MPSTELKHSEDDISAVKRWLGDARFDYQIENLTDHCMFTKQKATSILLGELRKHCHIQLRKEERLSGADHEVVVRGETGNLIFATINHRKWMAVAHAYVILRSRLWRYCKASG